jgi:hypothetical protein
MNFEQMTKELADLYRSENQLKNAKFEHGQECFFRALLEEMMIHH